MTGWVVQVVVIGSGIMLSCGLDETRVCGAKIG